MTNKRRIETHQSLFTVFTANNITAYWQTTNNIWTSLTNQVNNQRRIYTTYWRSTIHLTLKMTSAQVVETSVKVTTNSPSQDYTHPDDHNLRTYDMTPGFKPFTIILYLMYRCIFSLSAWSVCLVLFREILNLNNTWQIVKSWWRLSLKQENLGLTTQYSKAIKYNYAPRHTPWHIAPYVALNKIKLDKISAYSFVHRQPKKTRHLYRSFLQTIKERKRKALLY